MLHERGVIVRNPARVLPTIGDDEIELLPAPLNEAEVLALLDAMPRHDATDLRDRAQAELLYGCALRLGESLALDVTDVDFDRRLVVVRSGKGGRYREVPLMRGTALVVGDYLNMRRDLVRGPDSGALLLSNRGGRVHEAPIRVALRKAARAIGITRPIFPHLLRHSLAVHLLRGGSDLRIVQAWLGHASIETTRQYLRLLPGHLREVYDRAMPTVAVGLRMEDPLCEITPPSG